MTANTGNTKCRGMTKRARKVSRGGSAQILPALIAGSACSLMSGPAGALQLGDLEIQSMLGQPLRASIAFALSPNEQLYDFCILLKPNLTANGLPVLTRANISVASGRITLTSSAPVREPMMALRVVVDCPYTANLSRSYTMMLDPTQSEATPDVVRSSQRAARTPVQTPATVDSGNNARIPADQIGGSLANSVTAEAETIALSSRYSVKVGDTLSGIASRIEGRPIGLWPAVNAIFDANPDAFMNGNINSLKAGSMLEIPALDGAMTVPIQAASEEATTPALTSEEAEAYVGYVPDATPIADDFATQDSADLLNQEPASSPLAATGTATSSVAETESLATPLSDIQPGDIAFGSDSAFVSPIDSSQPQDAPITVADIVVSPAAPVPVVSSSRATPKTNDSWSWMYWLGGSGIAVIFGLVVFGRKIRGRFGSMPIGTAIEPVHPDLAETARNEAITDIDIHFDDAEQNDTEYSLDADLGAGTGLVDNDGIEVAQNHELMSNGDLDTDLDMVLPEVFDEPAEAHPTDILPPRPIEQSSILDAEIMPVDDDYDMSMIVDATKQNLDDFHSTEKDLKAVPLDALAGDDSGEYTLDEPLGVEILEQDYEDEFSATQAANQEIEKVARELALRMDESEGDPTAEMPQSGISSEATSEMTLQMPEVAENEAFSDLDDTGVNEELTVNLPSAENDATVEMEVGSGKTNAK